jgi:hypothetical protein
MDEASLAVMGLDSYRRDVAIRRNARIVIQDSPMFSAPENLPSSQDRALLCCVATLSYV